MKLLIQASTLIVVIQAWVMLVHKRVVRRNSKPMIIYDPMLARDMERMANLNYIYNCNDVEAVNMLRMRRTPFSQDCGQV